jgi:hypothetical protein
MRVSGRPVRRVISSDALTVSDAPLIDLDLVRQIRQGGHRAALKAYVPICGKYRQGVLP